MRHLRHHHHQHTPMLPGLVSHLRQGPTHNKYRFQHLHSMIKYAHSMGFRAIEDNGMMGRTPEMQQKIGDTLASLGMHMGVFVVAFSSNDKINLTTGSQEWRDKFVQTCK